MSTAGGTPVTCELAMLIPSLCPLTAGVDSATEVYGYLQSLWCFLRRCSIQLMEVTHLCCWVSLLFGEQDDDMMEAAKALLSIFLHHRYNIHMCHLLSLVNRKSVRLIWIS